MIFVSDDALSSLPLGGSFEHVLSHNKLWDAIFFDVPVHQRMALQKMIGSYNAANPSSWSELSTELVDNNRMSKTTLEVIKKVFNVRGEFCRLHRIGPVCLFLTCIATVHLTLNIGDIEVGYCLAIFAGGQNN
jgi:hypothetical protein